MLSRCSAIAALCQPIALTQGVKISFASSVSLPRYRLSLASCHFCNFHDGKLNRVSCQAVCCQCHRGLGAAALGYRAACDFLRLKPILESVNRLSGFVFINLQLIFKFK